MSWNTVYLKFASEAEARIIDDLEGIDFVPERIGFLSWVEGEEARHSEGFHVNVRFKGELPSSLAAFVITPQYPKVVWA